MPIFYLWRYAWVTPGSEGWEERMEDWTIHFSLIFLLPAMNHTISLTWCPGISSMSGVLGDKSVYFSSVLLSVGTLELAFSTLPTITTLLSSLFPAFLDFFCLHLTSVLFFYSCESKCFPPLMLSLLLSSLLFYLGGKKKT